MPSKKGITKDSVAGAATDEGLLLGFGKVWGTDAIF